MLSVIFCFTGLLTSVIIYFFQKQKNTNKFLNLLLDYIFLFSVGLFSIFSATGHIFMGPEIAKQIGWAPGSPFQFEIGIANLSYGVLGVIGFIKKGSFRLATLIGWTLFLVGAFIGHLIQAFEYGDYAPYNWGIFIWFNDLLLPIFTLSLYFFLKNSDHKK